MAKKQDIFDRIKPDDLMDRVELPVEERAIFSPEMRSLIREELKSMVAALPVGQMITKVLEKEMDKLAKIEKELKNQIYWVKNDMGEDTAELRKRLEELAAKVRKNHDDLKTEIRQPSYTFGGFPLANGGLPFADWRFVEDGSNLSVQKKVSGTWTEVFAFTPNA